MAKRKPMDSVPLEDEADIIKEVGAELDEETGELVADIESVRKIGAIDVESVRDNRRDREIAQRKKNGERVAFNTRDPIPIYNSLLRSKWAPGGLDIEVKRLTGPSAFNVITSRPRNGTELYERLKELHGPSPEYEYEVKFLDIGIHKYAGTGRIVMPDARPSQGQQPMAYPPQGYQPPLQQSAQSVSAAPANMVEQFGQMLDMVQRWQRSQQQPTPQMSTPASSNVVEQFGQMLEMMQRTMGGQPQPVPQQAPPPPPQPAATGMSEMMQMFEGFLKMQERMQALAPRGPRQPQYDSNQGPFSRNVEGSSPSYGGPQGPGGYGRQPEPPQRQKTASELLRESITMVRSAAEAVREFEGILPSAASREPDEEPDEERPHIVEKVGDVQVFRKREDGNVDPWATGLANFPNAMKWVGEQYDKIQKNAERQRHQAQRPNLPPGYVEVMPGQPINVPPGYVAVPVSEQEVQAVITPPPSPQQELPPPPEQVPPPIQEELPAVRGWGVPHVPE